MYHKLLQIEIHTNKKIQRLKLKELQNILPIELEEAFSSPEFENDGGLEICSVKYLENELLLNFSFYSEDQDERRKQYWQLGVNGYIESKIGDFGSFISFYSEHILLAEFQDIETELYFKRKGDYPELLQTNIFGISIEENSLTDEGQLVNNYDKALEIQKEIQELTNSTKTYIQLEYAPADDEEEFDSDTKLWQIMNESKR